MIRHGFIVLEVERGNSARTDDRRVASVSKAICATVLAIASDRSQHGLSPKKMRLDDAAFQFIPWSQPLSDPRKAKVTVKQLLNHTSGICSWENLRRRASNNWFTCESGGPEWNRIAAKTGRWPTEPLPDKKTG